MKFEKIFIIPLILFLFILYSCSEETRYDIGETLDTTVQIIGDQIDTLTDKVSNIGVDTLFINVNITEVDTAGLVPKNFRSKLNGVFKDYEDIKDALTKNDTSSVIAESNQLRKSLENVSEEDLAENRRAGWTRSMNSLNQTASEIASAKNITDQRRSFTKLTTEMLSLIKNFGLSNRTIYHLECTGTGGGSWLTESKNTDNPFAGPTTKETAGVTTSTHPDTITLVDTDKRNDECVSIKEAWKFD